ncbi:MAG: Rrf2 family transcriptional regulator, partial [Armatimonadetes bacterium]|nr:Rrf2 family transcriptional regulator [Armatimonadota bacterium]
MKFSAQEEYGLRCLLALAGAADEATLTIPVIARAEGLTQSHVAKLLALLRKGGFVNST